MVTPRKRLRKKLKHWKPSWFLTLLHTPQFLDKIYPLVRDLHFKKIQTE